MQSNTLTSLNFGYNEEVDLVSWLSEYLASHLTSCSNKEQRRPWHPTPVLLPGKFHGWRSLVGCSPWGREESDTTERPHFHFSFSCIGEGNGNSLQCSCLEDPRDGEPGGLPSMRSHGVGHDWSDLAAAAAAAARRCSWSRNNVIVNKMVLYLFVTFYYNLKILFLILYTVLSQPHQLFTNISDF